MRKEPVRTCMGCYTAKLKKELIRVVKSQDGEISIDFTGKKQGRGAYICKSELCLEKAIKARRFSKAFSMQIDQDIYDKLRDELTKKEVHE